MAVAVRTPTAGSAAIVLGAWIAGMHRLHLPAGLLVVALAFEGRDLSLGQHHALVGTFRASARRCLSPAGRGEARPPRTPLGEMWCPCLRRLVAHRTWPNARCSNARRTIASSISGAVRFRQWLPTSPAWPSRGRRCRCHPAWRSPGAARRRRSGSSVSPGRAPRGRSRSGSPGRTPTC